MAFAFCIPLATKVLVPPSHKVFSRSSWTVALPCSSGRVQVRNAASYRAPVMAEASLHLPPELSRIVDGFAAVPDVKMRYQQLLFYARKLPNMDPALKTDENKVSGCASLVHVKVNIVENGRVLLSGDSDSQLVKGLVAVLVNGLNGCTPEEVLAISPEFIVVSGLSVSLTPSRTNGFVNMIAKIKRDTLKLISESTAEKESGADLTNQSLGDASAKERPILSAIKSKLQVLVPQELEVRDHSSHHVNHQSMKQLNQESHFAVRIVSDSFEDMSLVERHRLVFKILADEVRHTHALNIDAKTPAEVRTFKARTP